MYLTREKTIEELKHCTNGYRKLDLMRHLAKLKRIERLNERMMSKSGNKADSVRQRG